jgi:cysteine desulfurase
VPCIEGESMVLMCDEAKIEVATGSACSAHDLSPSHVLIAINEPLEDIHGSLRFSMGRSTTKKELEYVLLVFPHLVKQLTDATALTTKHYEKTRNSFV